MPILTMLEDKVMEKTTWGVKSLTEELYKVFITTTMDTATQQIYGQVLHNFEVYTKANTITSIGRNQFIVWLHAEVGRQKMLCTAEPGLVVTATATVAPKPKPKRPVVPRSANINESPSEELIRLRKENIELKGVLEAAKMQIAKMDDIIKVIAAVLNEPNR